MNPESVSAVEWFASSYSVTELLDEANGSPDNIVEIVGDWIEEELGLDSSDDWQEWSDLCQVFYGFWGCLDIPSHSPEWDKFWNDKLEEEEG